MHTDETGGSHVQSPSSGLGDGPGSALDEGEEEEGPGPRGDAAQGEGETGNAHWPNWLVADIALAISKALSPTTVADRAPFLRFLPLMDHDAILNLRTEYKKLVQSGGKERCQRGKALSPQTGQGPVWRCVLSNSTWSVAIRGLLDHCLL
jgi:hypothetical protein